MRSKRNIKLDNQVVELPKKVVAQVPAIASLPEAKSALPDLSKMVSDAIKASKPKEAKKEYDHKSDPFGSIGSAEWLDWVKSVNPTNSFFGNSIPTTTFKKYELPQVPMTTEFNAFLDNNDDEFEKWVSESMQKLSEKYISNIPVVIFNDKKGIT